MYIKNPCFNTMKTYENEEKEERFENIMGKEKDSGNQHFLLFP